MNLLVKWWKRSDASWIGQRVVGEINVVCGQCEQCLNGRSTHCENRTVLGIVNRDGTFAEFTTLPIANLHRVPDSVPDEMAVFTEPLAAALEIQEQIQIKPTDRVLLVGAGRLGQLIAQTLALTGCDLRVVARHAHQQSLLKARGIRIISEEEYPTLEMGYGRGGDRVAERLFFGEKSHPSAWHAGAEVHL